MAKRRIEDFNDAMLMDMANVAAIFKIKESFEDNKKIDWFDKCSFKDYEWIETDWEEVMMDVKKEKYVCKRTLITKEYVDWFLKIIKAFYNKKIDIDDLILYENKIKNCPVLIIYNTLGMILAPRVSNDDSEDKFDFKDYVEITPKPKKK